MVSSRTPRTGTAALRGSFGRSPARRARAPRPRVLPVHNGFQREVAALRLRDDPSPGDGLPLALPPALGADDPLPVDSPSQVAGARRRQRCERAGSCRGVALTRALDAERDRRARRVCRRCVAGVSLPVCATSFIVLHSGSAPACEPVGVPPPVRCGLAPPTAGVHAGTGSPMMAPLRGSTMAAAKIALAATAITTKSALKPQLA